MNAAEAIAFVGLAFLLSKIFGPIGAAIGAGGGGFLLLFAPPEKQASVRASLNTLIQVPFKFDFSGSQIIFCDREAEYEEEERARAGQAIRAFRELSK